MEHIGAGQDGDVPGVLLLHAQAAGPVLRKHGIPFHNPYRHSQRLLEPAARSASAVSTANRILALLVGAPELRRGPPPVDARRFGAVGRVARSPRASCATAPRRSSAGYDIGATPAMEHLDGIFEPAALESLMDALGRRLPRAARVVARPR